MQCNEASVVSDAFCANSPSVNYVCVGRDSRSFFVTLETQRYFLYPSKNEFRFQSLRHILEETQLNLRVYINFI